MLLLGQLTHLFRGGVFKVRYIRGIIYFCDDALCYHRAF